MPSLMGKSVLRKNDLNFLFQTPLLVFQIFINQIHCFKIIQEIKNFIIDIINFYKKFNCEKIRVYNIFYNYLRKATFVFGK